MDVSSPSTLYIIGNGFDLWHGIPSSLASFKDYVRGRDRDIYREIGDYLPTREDWSDLETALADLDVDVIIENLGHFMGDYGADEWSDSGHHDFQYEVENLVDRLSVGMRRRFGEWIRCLPIPNWEKAPQRLASLDPGAAFLNFNYTSTLSTTYGIASKHVLFIHGCAALADKDLVLGHAWDPKGRKPFNDREDIAEIDTRLVEANELLDAYFSETFKRSDVLIAENAPFFESLENVRNVFVLGHSLANVDAAYFKALLAQPAVATARWSIACRNLEEWPAKHDQLARLGLSPLLAHPISWSAL